MTSLKSFTEHRGCVWMTSVIRIHYIVPSKIPTTEINTFCLQSENYRWRWWCRSVWNLNALLTTGWTIKCHFTGRVGNKWTREWFHVLTPKIYLNHIQSELILSGLQSGQGPPKLNLTSGPQKCWVRPCLMKFFFCPDFCWPCASNHRNTNTWPEMNPPCRPTGPSNNLTVRPSVQTRGRLGRTAALQFVTLRNRRPPWSMGVWTVVNSACWLNALGIDGIMTCRVHTLRGVLISSPPIECTVAGDSSHSRQIVFTLPRRAMQRENRSINLPLMLKTWWENIGRTSSRSVTVAILGWKLPEFISGRIYSQKNPAARRQVGPSSYCQ